MFQHTDAALLRAAAYPSDLTLPDWPDLTTDSPRHWIDWLAQVWALPEFPDAVTQAAPDLADRIKATLAGDAMATRRLRRLTEATLRYLLRWTTRATPFGRFAGIAPIGLWDRTAVTWGDSHRDVARPDDQYVAEQAAAGEGDLPTLRTVRVVTNALGFRRGQVWVVPCARTREDRFWDVEISLTKPVRVVIETAREPVRFTDLVVTAADQLDANLAETEELLMALVREGVLVSELQPPMTATRPVPHLANHVTVTDPGNGIVVDRRLDCTVSLPPAVVREAQDAATTLSAVAPRLPGWDPYHAAFLDRWGPGAAVPVREVLAVLGFPTGYRSAPRSTTPPLTATDSHLMSLAQQSALNGGADIVLDDDLIAQLVVDGNRPPIPHTELRFNLAADTPGDLDRGEFTLTVVSGARHAAVAAARFLHLLSPDELDRFRAAYQALPTSMPGGQHVQLSAPPLEARLATLARSPELLPVLPIGDFHPDPACTIDDLAVAGDANRLWLVSRTSGQPVEPLLVNSVMLPTAQQPLVRFLTEIWTAWNAPCTPFNWGHARALPFLPRVRRGRSILHPARWVISNASLPRRDAPWSQWHDAWQVHRARNRIPRKVLIGRDDVRIQLDLDESAHLALLRSDLDKHPTVVLTEAPGPAGWIDGRPAEILLTLTSTPPEPRPAPRPARPAHALQHRPGSARWLEARFHGPTDPILAHFARTGLPDGTWFLRYPRPARHLRVRVPLGDVAFAEAARDLAEHAAQLHDDGILTDYTLNTYRPETRYGADQTLAAAEAVFAADSHAVLRDQTEDRQAATAAGMTTIAHAFTGDGPRWLADHAPHRSGPRLNPAQLAAARRHDADQRLADAVAAYRKQVDDDGLDADWILADLLHMHHARRIGVDQESERHCLRLARALALTDLARRTP